MRPPAGFAAVNYGIAGVYGLLITVPSLVALFFYFRTIQQSHRFAVVTGKGYRPKAYDLGRFRPAGLLFVLVYLSLAVFLPVLCPGGGYLCFLRCVCPPQKRYLWSP